MQNSLNQFDCPLNQMPFPQQLKSTYVTPISAARCESIQTLLKLFCLLFFSGEASKLNYFCCV